jgi:hypothetical protein
MGMLDSFEKKLDRMVNGAFAKAFKSEVQPVEIAAGLQRELDDRASVVSRSRTVVPNAFVVELSPDDHTRLAAFESTVGDELAALVQEYAQQQRYVLLGPAQVSLAGEGSLGTGVFRIRSEVIPSPNAPAPVALDLSGQPHIQADGAQYELRAVTRLGRGSDTDIRIDDPGVSRHHAEIVLGTEVTIRDLGSTNGTLVNGRVVSTTVLNDGDRIQLGATTVTYRAR